MIKKKTSLNIVFFMVFITLLPMSIYAKTIELRIENSIDYNFTNNYKLSFSNDSFLIDGKSIKPFISILNHEQDLKNVFYTNIIKDNKYNYEFGFDMNSLSLSNIDYVGFDLKGFKRLDDISFTDGKIRIIFEDLMDKGSLEIVNDSRIILYNPTSLTIDPIIELLPNATNKAYVISSTGTDSPDQAITEFSIGQYSAVSTSNNAYATSIADTRITYAGCTLSDNIYECLNSGEPCTDSRCTAASVCKVDECNIGTCTALSHATATSSGSCVLSPTNGYSCGCFSGGCSGVKQGTTCTGEDLGECTVSGTCSYTCNAEYYNCDGNDANGCEATTPCWIYTFQRFTFNLSDYDMATSNITSCWEGYYVGHSASSGNLLYYNNNTATWVNWKTLTNNSESTSCIYFDITNNTIYNSTSKLVQFSARGNQSKTGHLLTVYSDFVNLTINYTVSEPPTTVKCEYLCRSDNLDYTLFIRNNDVLIGNDRLFMYNLDNENLTNLDTNCIIFGDYKDNFCVNLNSGKAIYTKWFNE